ncbi:DNA methyltransferase [Gordonia sp. QH-12]|uniref:DNA cytosine methyltransferase n=1 Tax=Gordonia sp. QH-12 TaxID=1437876 RepID=UPI000782C473|nr:DNA cytosine methyltransferase [Gordonia sp. QH-12]KXT57336.1 DNA methyltransferase [Gordonia sp. QH-12]
MLTMTDLFCGAGGSSTGAIQVPGVSVRVASNHWDLAVQTHNENHQDADHICADISQIDPRLFPTSDVLWASPECTNHSVAKGRKRAGNQPDLFGEVLPDAAAERSRATMWDVPRFAEHHQYRAIIVENVVDAARWVMFDAWLMAMHSLGYRHQIVWMNSMHANYVGAGAAQSRDRMYVVFTLEGNPVPKLNRLCRPLAVCDTCGPVKAMQSWKKPDRPAWGRYRAQYVYRCPNVTCRNAIVEPIVRPAAEIIDWSIEGQRIGDRARPLADKTMRRIQAGIDRYWRPLIAEAETDGLVVPVEGRVGKTATSTADPLRTMTTRNETGIAVPCGGTWRESATSLADPLPTRTTIETDGVAFLTQFRDRIRDLDPHREPLTTVVADGANHGLVQMPPFIAELRGGGSDARSTTDPLSTVTASGNHHALLMRNYTARGDAGHMSTPITEPARTITTAGHQSLVDAPVPTIDIQDVHFRMLEPTEIIRAMDFPDTYTVLGNRREKVRMAGNAVTPCAARDLLAVVAESLGVVA